MNVLSDVLLVALEVVLEVLKVVAHVVERGVLVCVGVIGNRNEEGLRPRHTRGIDESDGVARCQTRDSSGLAAGQRAWCRLGRRSCPGRAWCHDWQHVEGGVGDKTWQTIVD